MWVTHSGDSHHSLLGDWMSLYVRIWGFLAMLSQVFPMVQSPPIVLWVQCSNPGQTLPVGPALAPPVKTVEKFFVYLSSPGRLNRSLTFLCIHESYKWNFSPAERILVESNDHRRWRLTCMSHRYFWLWMQEEVLYSSIHPISLYSAAAKLGTEKTLKSKHLGKIACIFLILP